MGILSVLLKKLFVAMPPIVLEAQEKAAYERLLTYTPEHAGIARISYNCSYPKERFIAYMTEYKGFLVHGSNNKKISRFETRRQTLYNGKYVNAVFATKDAIWPVFYAVLNRAQLIGNFRNGCLRIKNDQFRYYFFSLTEQTINNCPWTDGTIYFLPPDNFSRASKGSVYFDEWISKVEVKPLYKLDIAMNDFSLATVVSCHRSEESILKTWFLYKRRLKKNLLSYSNVK